MRSEQQKLDWVNIISILILHLIGLIGPIYYFSYFGFYWPTLILSLVWFLLCSFSITAGYHRLFTHRSYKCHSFLEWLWLFFGAASSQGSAKDWVYIHLRHHAADTNPKIVDPHDIKKGFWWAHFIWLFFKNPTGRVSFLENKKSFGFQHRYYFPLLVFFGFVLPGLIALWWQDFIGGVLLAGFTRTVLEWHMTWTINSIAHSYGCNLFKRPDQSRNNYFFARLFLALGEIYHSFHHQFPKDYRNGHRKLDFDPTKWLIYLLSKIGLTWDLWSASEEDIEKTLAKVRSLGN